MGNKSLNIQWLTKSPSMLAYANGDQSIQLSGGRLYELLAVRVLSGNYNVSINRNFIKTENPIKFFLKNHKKSINADICILDPYILAYGKFDRSKRNIAIIHHVDEGLGKMGVLGKVFLKRMISNLKKVDRVVVVSEFWKDYLEKKGVKNISVIYNSYNLRKFNFQETDKQLLKSRFNIEEGKPIIYLGKNGTGKGIEDILKVVNHEKYQLIATGKKEVSNKNVKTYFFTEDEFPLFLACCDVVLCMSTMVEGWNRIAHEALLSKSPVIGSGTGGMQELLEKSGQIIVKDLNEINDKIEHCLKNSKQLTVSGYQYTSTFDLKYFESSWNKLIEELE